jgi:hypothetical protein
VPAVSAPSAPPLAGLQRVATGLRFGVSSTLFLSVDSATGDVGLSVSNVRVGFGAGGEDLEGGAGADDDDDGHDDDDLDEEDEDGGEGARAGAGAGGRGGSRASRAICAPRSPPAPFRLVARCGAVEDAAQVFHSVDPSMANGAAAYIHAAACRLPLPSLRASGGAGGAGGTGALQLCFLARSPAGLVVSLVPALRLVERGAAQ